ncbi:LOW QUALITY PROTEIN: ubiquitin-associated protein 1 [Callorhinchus milii]|uniref:UMA domain-containing protein n=1 Tax=Callorhinchus milii TaxID=7868 RepID=A0A4W3JUQ8_CALMI|nr:LOW QUALITY PROTEIN: ubiquitin-associated protein 1 [Callorhinchus milii]|eukprot:gi/632938211/ref/XP_007904133.1/ PREDICTED: ubiquitin-associated protein 1-like [Callorhinchus milii]
MSSSEAEVYSSVGGSSSCLEEISFRISAALENNSAEERVVISPLPDICLTHCFEILTQTQYDFSLEKEVLEWIRERGVTERVRAVPTCPPFWLAFPDPEEESSEDPNDDSPCDYSKAMRGHVILQTRRCRSFSVTDDRHIRPRVAYISSESDDGYSEDDELSSSDESEDKKFKLPSVPIPRVKCNSYSRLLDGRPASSPFLDSASRSKYCEKHRNVNVTRLPHIYGLKMSTHSSGTDAEQEVGKRCSPSWLQDHHHHHQQQQAPKKLYRKSFSQLQPNRNSKNPFMPQFGSGSPPLAFTRRHLARSSPPSPIAPIRRHKPPIPSLSPYSCLPAPPSTSKPLDSHKPLPDSYSDLLLALSQKEQELIQTVVDRGYPIRRVIWAIQNIGQRSTQQIVAYLSAWDRLCKEGYEEPLVEEALEIFQNSEAKAAEFLTLVTQFNEMGFQHEDIKEVLLVHNNHQGRALEELMTRS